MTRQDARCVLCSRATFECAFRKIAENTDQRHYYCERQNVFKWQFTEEPEVRESTHRERGNNSTNRAFPRLAGTDFWGEFMFAESAADVIRACICTHQHKKEEREQVC